MSREQSRPSSTLATDVSIDVPSIPPQQLIKMNGTHFSSGDEQQMQVLFIHGMGSSHESYHERGLIVADHGLDALTFTYNSHGNQRSNFAQITAAYDWLHTRNPEKEIAVCGTSYGAYLALLLRVTRQIDHYLLRAPALSPHDSRVQASLSSFTGSLWIVLSELDIMFSDEDTQALLEAAPQANPKMTLTIPNADHGLTSQESKNAYLTILASWVHSLTAVSPESPSGD